MRTALTIGNARAFNLDKDRGTLEIGKRAELLVLGQNPLRTAKAYDRLDWVVLQGRVVAFEPPHPFLNAEGRSLPAPLKSELVRGN